MEPIISFSINPSQHLFSQEFESDLLEKYIDISVNEKSAFVTKINTFDVDSIFNQAQSTKLHSSALKTLSASCKFLFITV